MYKLKLVDKICGQVFYKLISIILQKLVNKTKKFLRISDLITEENHRLIAQYYNLIIIAVMTRKILQIGSSVGVTIPQSILDKLGLEVGEEVEIETDKESGDLRIRPQKQANDREDRIARRTMDFIERYRDDLEALADK